MDREAKSEASKTSLGRIYTPSLYIHSHELTVNRRQLAPQIILGLPQTVTFTARNNLPLPDPRYLALHAACANVAHLSGAGEYIDSVDRDIDAIRVLVKDGSSNTVLAKAMTRIWITA